MRKIIIAAALAAFPLTAHAQDHSKDHAAMSQDMSARMAPEKVELPKACMDAAGSSMDMSKMMGGMDGMMASGSSEVVKANMDAMMKMHGPMMQAAMIKDPDLAFNCGMIAHHQGAIAMSEVELKMGKDEPSRKMAQLIIDVQRKEIDEMTARVETLAK